MRFLIGIDGGGTKTDIVLCDFQGQVLAQVKKDGTNLNDIGVEKAMKIVREGINELLSNYDKSDIKSVFAGFSGGITGGNSEVIHKELVRIIGDKAIVQNHSDAMSALTGGLGDKNGCVIISGTGSIGYGRKNCVMKQVGGYGYLIDRGGSGYDLGRDALYHALCHKDGRGKRTLMTELIEKQIGDLFGELDDIYRQGKRYIASFAPVVFEAYRSRDEIAREVVEFNAAELAKIFNVMGDFLGAEDCNAVLAGSVFNDFEIIEKHLKPHLKYEFNYIFPKHPPVYGSVLQAAIQAGIKITEEFKENLSIALLSDISKMQKNS